MSRFGLWLRRCMESDVDICQQHVEVQRTIECENKENKCCVYMHNARVNFVREKSDTISLLLSCKIMML